MSKFFKISLLFAILLIPVAIFMFLRVFGSNQFEIPIYYTSGITSPFEECQHTAGQHLVKGFKTAPAVAFFFKESSSIKAYQINNINERLDENFPEVPKIYFTEDSTARFNAQTEYLHQDGFTSKMHCNFVTDTVNQFILIDGEKRIRGYYNTDLEEVDRLIVELKILLENERNTSKERI